MMPLSRRRAAGCLFTLLLSGCAQDSDPGSAPAAESAMVSGGAAPAVLVPGAFPPLRLPLLDGSEYDIASHKGNWVVVNFWATWCAPCIKEMPELSALHDAHDNVRVVGLAYEQIEPATLRDALARRPVSYPIAIVDPFEMPPGIPSPRGLPMTYLIDPLGALKREFLGPVTRADLERAIAAQ